MFRCQECYSQRPIREKQFKVVVRTRMKDYYNKRGRYEGSGVETVEEKTIGQCCAKEVYTDAKAYD